MSSSSYKFNKLHCKDTKSKSDENYERENNSEKEKLNSAINENDTKKLPTASTPVRKATVREAFEDDALSPMFMRFTQDNVDEDVDVVWDWDSPHSDRNKRHLYKKRIQHSSPKIPRKQILFEKAKPKFNALKAQLENLVSQVTDELKSDDSNDCLMIDDSIFLKPIVPQTAEKPCDMFDDDSLDEEMIKCSQIAEEDYNISKWCTSIVNNNKNKVNNTIEDDSFDVVLEDINEDHLLSQASGSSENSSQNYPYQHVPKNNIASPRALSRTNSVPVDFLTSKINVNSKVSTSSFARTKSEHSVRNNIAIKCSPEEIEKKRLDAMALLEKKRKQNEIERKRQEALERLNRNRLQRMQKNRTHPIKR